MVSETYIEIHPVIAAGALVIFIVIVFIAVKKGFAKSASNSIHK